MAIVSTGYSLTVKFVDNSGFGTTRSYALVAADAAEAATATAAILAALDPLTDALITGYSVSQGFQDDANPALPGIAVQVENQALVVVGLSDYVNKRATLSIPAPVAGLFMAASGPGADIVDTNDAALLTFANLFTVAGGMATISDGETIDGVISGTRRHVASARH